MTRRLTSKVSECSGERTGTQNTLRGLRNGVGEPTELNQTTLNYNETLLFPN